MQQRGFTIIEAMVVVAIMAVLVTMAGPGLGVWMDNLRIRGTSEAIQQGIQTARAEAIRRNQPVTFWLVSHNAGQQLDNTCDLDSNSGSWVVSIDSPAKLCATDISTTSAPRIVAKRPMADSGAAVTVTAVQSDRSTEATSITFNGFGRVNSADTAISEINIQGPNTDNTYKSLRIQVSSAGQIRACEPGITTTGDPRKC